MDTSPLKHATAAAVALIFVVGAAPFAAGSPVDLFGLSARGQALGNAVVSTARGYEAVYYNPAGLIRDTRPSVSLGYSTAIFDLSIDGSDRDVRDAPTLTIGFSVPLPFGGALKDRIALGVGFAIPQQSVLVVDIPRPSLPSFVIVENRAQTVSLTAGLAVRIIDELQVGISVLALAKLGGAIAVAPTPAGNLGTAVSDELLASYSMIIGVQSQATDWLAVGLTYRSESRADFDLPIEADLGDDFLIPLPPLDVRGTAQYDPAEVALELGLRPLPWLLLSPSVVWQQWSKFPQPIEFTAVPDGTPPQPLPGFGDTWSPRMGIEATFDPTEEWQLTGRLGVQYEPTPVPEQTGFHNHLDSDRTVLTAGFGAKFGIISLDLAAQYHAMAARTHTKTAPDLPDDHPGTPAISHKGQVWQFGGALEVQL